MSSDAQLSMKEVPQPSKLRPIARRRLRFVVPLAGTVLFGWLVFRLDASGTAANLNSITDRLRCTTPSLICFAVTYFFLLWCILAVNDKEPRWAAAIANLRMVRVPERRKAWDLRAYLADLGFIAFGGIGLIASDVILQRSKAILMSRLASAVSLFFLFVVLGQFSNGGQGPVSRSGN
jgi:hypothetical protein